jgi:rubrerythrin
MPFSRKKPGRAFSSAPFKEWDGGQRSVVSAFQRLIAEEEKHILLIKSILEKLEQGEGIDLEGTKDLELGPKNYFEERSEAEFLQRCLEGSMVPEVTIFNTAWLIEKDLSEFYEKMAQQTEGKAKEAFAFLSRWEKEHEKFFREYRDKFSEMYSRIPWGG